MSIRKEIGKALNALAHANAGEMLSYDEKLAVLGAGGRRRAVAVSATAACSPASVDYVIDTCRRVDAELVVLVRADEAIPAEVEQCRLRLAAADVIHRIVPLEGEWVPAVSRYLREHGEILFMILHSADGELHAQPSRARSATGAERGDASPVPVPVVVVEPLPGG